MVKHTIQGRRGERAFSHHLSLRIKLHGLITISVRAKEQKKIIKQRKNEKESNKLLSLCLAVLSFFHRVNT